MSDFAEHEMIRRHRVGYGVGATYDQWDTATLEKLWTVGMNSTPNATAVKLRAAAQDAIESEGFSFSDAARANLAKWDTYVTKYAAVTALTPAQYAAQKSKGTLLAQLTSGKGFGGILDSAKSLVGLGGPSAPLLATGQPSKGFLDSLLTPAGLIGTVLVAAAGGYAYTKSKKRGR